MLDGDILDHWYNCFTMYVFYSVHMFTCHSAYLTLKFQSFVCAAIAWLIIPMDVNIERGWFTFHSWNLFVAICAIPRYFVCLHAHIGTTSSLFFLLVINFHLFNILSLLLGCWLFCFPESPKFLIECGETEEALEILRRMYQENTGNKKTDYPVCTHSMHHKNIEPIYYLLFAFVFR